MSWVHSISDFKGLGIILVLVLAVSSSEPLVNSFHVRTHLGNKNSRFDNLAASSDEGEKCIDLEMPKECNQGDCQEDYKDL